MATGRRRLGGIGWWKGSLVQLLRSPQEGDELLLIQNRGPRGVGAEGGWGDANSGQLFLERLRRRERRKV